MELLPEHNACLESVTGKTNLNLLMEATSDHFDGNENSPFLMNPVASGDNVATGRNSLHKFKEDLPSLVPCCEGKELQINEDLVRSGLSAISVKNDNVIASLSMSSEKQIGIGLVKHRNSFRCLHRPELKRIPYLRRMSRDELETIFNGFSDSPSRCSNNNSDYRLDQSSIMIKPDKDTNYATKDKSIENGLLTIPETKSGAEDIPAGKRLHGARARLYTSVLAGAKTGDQLDGSTETDEYDHHIPIEDPVPDDEVQITEELQILLPPKMDEDILNEESSKFMESQKRESNRNYLQSQFKIMTPNAENKGTVD